MPSKDNEDSEIRGLSGNLAVDVGAYTGYITLLLSARFSRVIAIEPHPRNRTILLRHLQHRGVKNVQVVSAAISNRENKSATLFTGKDSSTHSLLDTHVGLGSETSYSSKSTQGSNDAVHVPVTTLAKLLENEQSIDFIKVDVEGAELLVLQGSKAIINRIRKWMVEVHSPPSSQLAEMKSIIEGWFVKNGYRIRWVDKHHIFASREREND